MDIRSLINNNLQTIGSELHIIIQDLIDGVPVPKPNLADKWDDVQKHNILFILYFNGTRNGIIEIPGFKVMSSEICLILYLQPDITLYITVVT